MILNTYSLFANNDNGPLVINIQRFEDNRGFFEETFRTDELLKIGLPPFVQENHSCSRPPVLRGLHYQLNPMEQGKLVYCMSGFLTDVVVDIRKTSPTYGRWEKIELDSRNPRMLYVPPGFAHGFFVYGCYDPGGTHLVYKTTNYYNKSLDRAIRWNDPDIAIDWGPFLGPDVIISEKDQNAPYLKDADNNF